MTRLNQRFKEMGKSKKFMLIITQILKTQKQLKRREQ